MNDPVPVPAEPTPEEKAAAERAVRLTKAQASKEAREEKEKVAAEDRLIAVEELTELLSGKLGEVDKDFAIISNPHGVFGLRKPDGRAIRVWETTNEKKKLDLGWMVGFLRPYIEPADKSLVWAQTCGDRPGLCWQTSTAFVLLLGVDRSALEKK